MFSFRQKILISYVLVFLLFLCLMYPFSTRTVQKIAIKAMEDRASEVIEKVRSAPNNDALIRKLKDLKATIFFRMSVITNERKVLYDSHTKRLLGPRFSQEYVVNHPEVLQAFKEGVGYQEDYSDILAQKFAYMAKSFDFHGKTYVMRIAFPYEYVSALTHDLELGFLILATAILLLFTIMTWFVINHLTNPIQQIIKAVRPYQDGELLTVPEIHLKTANSHDEFGKLASTLNSLSLKIQSHISSLTQARNEKETILESLTEGVIGVDEEMIINYANTTALKMLGVEHQELIGQGFTALNQGKCFTLLQNCQLNKQVLTDTIYIKRNGEKIALDVLASPKKDQHGALLVMQDKTPQYKLLEMRKDFIANASHELKTPITIIRGFAETLHDNPDLSVEIREEVTGKIVNNCERMNNLIKDLLILTDVENLPESRLHECQVSNLLLKSCATVEAVYPDAKIHTINFQNVDSTLFADPHLLELAFNNLIENAAKYSGRPAHISIELAKVNSDLQIKIADRGIGIPQADLEHIFERFYTVNKAHSRKMGGSGLGLSIVEMIVKKHFGKISVSSEVNVGTTFTLLLPIKRNA